MNPFDQENLSQAKEADDVIDDGKDPPRSAGARDGKKRRGLTPERRAGIVRKAAEKHWSAKR